jgi:xylan 1,4-beta-xylosidase
MKKNSALVFLTVLFTFFAGHANAQSGVWPLTVNLQDTLGILRPVWASFGYDEPNVTYTADGKKLLSELAALSPAPVYVRAHNLLTTGDGTYALKWGSTGAYTLNTRGNPVYNWRIMDSIFDVYSRRSMVPIAEIGFMPKALSTHPEPYRHHWKPGMPYQLVYTGWSYPPKDYKKWGTLVYAWVKHAVKRYGAPAVKTWRWEVWNEPNIGYWHGTPEQYFELYDYTAQAVKQACPGAQVGGPASTGPGGKSAAAFLKAFLTHCARGKNYATGKEGAPLDFISFHAKGSPRIIHGHVQMNLSPELRDVQEGFRQVAASPFAHIPVFITEFDPEGCAACGMTTNPENAYRNGMMYASYTAAAFGCLYDLIRRYHINLIRATSWSFTFENQPWFDGFRSLATHGIDKPVLNVFRMFGLMGGSRVRVHNPQALPIESILRNSVHGGTPDIRALATADSAGASIMVWNYYDADVPRPQTTITITIKHIPAQKILLQHYRIDKQHSNAYSAWKQMGSPGQVSEAQYQTLESRGQLQLLDSPRWIATPNHTASLTFTLPSQSISLLKLNYKK